MAKIAFLGASLTEGVYGGSYFKALQKRLPQHELLNFGVGGSTVNKLLERVGKVIDAEPDAVFVLSGSNDAIAYSNPKTRVYYRSNQDIPDGYYTPEEFSALYRELLTELQLAHIQVLVGLAPLEYNPAVVEASRLFNDTMREVARSMNLPVLDLHPRFVPDSIPERPELDLGTILLIGERVASGWNDYKAAKQEGDYTYTFDGIHFTPAAAERAAEIMVPFFEKHVS